MNWSRMLQSCRASASSSAVVDDHVVELGGFRQFEFGLGHAAVDHFRGVRAAAFEPSAQLLDRGRHDEHRAGVVAEDALEVDAADHVDVEDDHMALGPDALHLRAQRAVAGSLVDLLPLHEAVFGHGLHELLVREEVVVHPVALLAAGGAAGRRDGEFELRDSVPAGAGRWWFCPNRSGRRI